MRTIAIGLLVAAMCGAGMHAQSTPRNPGIYKSAAQVRAEIEKSTPELGIVAGQTAEVVVANGGRIVVRRRMAGPNNASVHDDVTKVYYVMEGRGHMKLGGRLTDWKRRPVSAGNGKGSVGTTAVGSKDVTITKGDVLIIPAGTPHKWEMAEEFTSYVVVRVDPDGVTPLMELGTATFPPRN